MAFLSPPPVGPIPGDRIASAAVRCVDSAAVRDCDVEEDEREGALRRVPAMDPPPEYREELERIPPRRRAAPDERVVATEASADLKMVSPARDPTSSSTRVAFKSANKSTPVPERLKEEARRTVGDAEDAAAAPAADGVPVRRRDPPPDAVLRLYDALIGREE